MKDYSLSASGQNSSYKDVIEDIYDLDITHNYRVEIVTKGGWLPIRGVFRGKDRFRLQRSVIGPKGVNNISSTWVLIDPPTTGINLVLLPELTRAICLKIEHVKTSTLTSDPYNRIAYDLFMKCSYPFLLFSQVTYIGQNVDASQRFSA